MKKVTKKLVLKALESDVGWNFDCYFKETQKIILLWRSNDDRIREHLLANGIKVTEYRPRQSPCTGHMKLSMEN